jgi:hypothetical protein
MNSTPDTKDVLSARADEQLARVRERIASADEQLARVTEQLSKIERQDVRGPSAEPGEDRVRPSDGPVEVAASPSAGPGLQPPRGKSAVPGSTDLLLIGLLLVACLVVATLASYFSRDGITLIAARWTQQPTSTSPSPPPTNSSLSTQAGPSAAEAAPALATPPAATRPQDAAPAAAGVPEMMQLQQAMARDVADLKREIEQLKVKQDQMASGNARAIEQLKAKQDDMARLLAPRSDLTALPRASPPSAGPPQSPQARMRSQAPRPRRQYPPRWQYDDEW